MSDRILQNYEGGRIPVHLKTIGEVELLELLGVGGFGMVWKVKETRKGDFYVLKIIQGMKPGSVQVERVRLEAEVSIPSRHVVKVFGLREWDPSTFLILFEYFPARTLDKLLHDRDFTPKRKRHIFSQILRGVADAHSCNIIHRDLKPANILVDNKDEVKLIDFGLSKFKGKGLTMTGDVMGTPPYMSPELLIYGSAIADARVDIYALGHILYEIAMDCTFWDKQGWPGNRFDDFVKFLSQVPQPPECIEFSDFSCDFYDKAKAVIARMVKTNPDERYNSVEEVIMAFGDTPAEKKEEIREIPAFNLQYPLLIVESGTNKDARTLINIAEGQTLTLGRADIAGNDLSISSRHLIFTRQGHHFFVRDNQSKNGTLLNGVMLKATDSPMRLNTGDRLKVGDIFLRCLLPMGS